MFMVILMNKFFCINGWCLNDTNLAVVTYLSFLIILIFNLSLLHKIKYKMLLLFTPRS